MVPTPMVRLNAASNAAWILAIAAALALPAVPAQARKRAHATADAAHAEKLEKSLMKLDPAELVSQVCDLGAMKAFGRDAEYSKTDRVLIDAVETPKIVGDKVTGEGGALRMSDQWFRFSYACTLAHDHMSATDFRYHVTGPIPEAKWAEFGLWH